MLWTACQISNHRAKLHPRQHSLPPAPLHGPLTTFLTTTPSNHIFFSLCRRLRFVESKAAGPPWRQQSKFNICMWGGKRIVFSACTQSLHWLVQKSGGLPHPENDQTPRVCVWLLNTECVIVVQRLCGCEKHPQQHNLFPPTRVWENLKNLKHSGKIRKNKENVRAIW